jgi:uncharacterized protein
MLGSLSAADIEATLQEASYGRLGCHANGRTYVVPVGYAYDGERLVCHSTEGLKIEMMRSNPNVCFEVEIVEDLGNWRSVVAWGKFVELKGTEAATALGLLIDRLTPLLPSAEMPRHGMRSVTPPAREPGASTPVIYAIHLEEKTGRFERIAERG